MARRILSTTIAAVLVVIGLGIKSASASPAEKENAARTAKVKAGILKLGIGEDARLAVKLRDKKLIGGYVSQAGEDSFVLTDLKTGDSTTIAYGDVKQAKGQNLTTGQKIAIGIGIGVAIVLIALLIYIKCCTG